MTTPREENLIYLVPLVGADAPRLQSIARQLAGIYERQCNGYQRLVGFRGGQRVYAHDEDAERRDLAREHRLQGEAETIAASHGFRTYHQTDPRGWPLYLYREEDLHGKDIDGCYPQAGTGVCPARR